MFKKGSIWRSVFGFKCPRCQEGDLFLSSNPYNLGKLGKMHRSCSRCGQTYNLEPGFYFGAAYVSYALAVALGVAAFVATYVLAGDVSEFTYIAIIGGVLVVAVPLIFTLSRSIWIAMFVRYDPKALDSE